MHGSSPIAHAPDIHPGLPKGERRPAFLSISLGVAMVVFDSFSLFVALPLLASEFGVEPSASIWLVLCYQLAVVAGLLPFATLSETVGFRRLHLLGLAFFVLGSLVAASSTSFAFLCGARILQGLSSAAVMAVHGAILRHIFSNTAFGAAVGVTTFVVSVVGAASPSLSAGILSIANWHWLFLVNAPLGLAAIATGHRSIRADTARGGTGIDLISVGLNALGFGLFILGVSGLGNGGSPMAFAALAGSAVLGLVLVRRQLPLRRPMLPIDLLLILPFACSVGAAILGFAAQTMAFIALPFFLHHLLGYTIGASGLVLTAWPLSTALVSFFVGWLIERVLPGRLGAIGMGVFVVAAMVLILLGSGKPSLWQLAGIFAVCGFGFGMFQAPNNKVMLSSVSRARSGAASGMQATSRLVGQSLGAALVSALLGAFGPDAITPVLVAAAGFAGLAGCAALLPELRKA